MMCHSIQPRDILFVKGYGFFSFAKNMGKILIKKWEETSVVNAAKKLIDHAKQSATGALST